MFIVHVFFLLAEETCLAVQLSLHAVSVLLAPRSLCFHRRLLVRLCVC